MKEEEDDGHTEKNLRVMGEEASLSNYGSHVLNGVANILGLHFCLLIPCIWIVKFMITLPTFDVRISFYNLNYVNNYLHDVLKTQKSTMVSKVCMYNAS